MYTQPGKPCLDLLLTRRHLRFLQVLINFTLNHPTPHTLTPPVPANKEVGKFLLRGKFVFPGAVWFASGPIRQLHFGKTFGNFISEKVTLLCDSTTLPKLAGLQKCEKANQALQIHRSGLPADIAHFLQSLPFH